MRNLIFFLLLFIGTNTYSQDIFLMNLSKSRSKSLQSSKLFKETTVFYTIYYPENVPKSKFVTHFNTNGKPVLLLRYDEKDILKQRSTITYDSTQTHVIGQKVENSDPDIGFNTIFESNQYDSNGLLTNIIQNDEKGKMIQETLITYNEKGDPTLVKNYVGNVFKKETAEYNYELNEVTIKQYNWAGELRNTKKFPIIFDKPQPRDIVNQYGDIIKSSTSENEIKYDEFGNWIKKVYSRIVDGKFLKGSEDVRTIIYKN